MNEITITAEAYTELVKKAHDGDCLKRALAHVRSGYNGMTYDEVKTLCALYAEEENNG